MKRDSNMAGVADVAPVKSLASCASGTTRNGRPLKYGIKPRYSDEMISERRARYETTGKDSGSQPHTV